MNRAISVRVARGDREFWLLRTGTHLYLTEQPRADHRPTIAFVLVIMMYLHWSLSILSALACVTTGAKPPGRQTCVIPASGSNTTNDAPAILHAFRKCGRGGKVIFKPTTYYINSVMNVTWLEDVDIDIRGELLVRYPWH